MAPFTVIAFPDSFPRTCLPYKFTVLPAPAGSCRRGAENLIIGREGKGWLKHKTHRFWQFDVIRGLAVVAMVFYHFVWDLSFFGLYGTDTTRGGWLIFARFWATVFISLMGFSMALTVGAKGEAASFHQWRGRGLKLLGWALLISLVTRFFLGDAFILFGILHLAATALLLAPWLWRLGSWAPWLGLAIITAGYWSSRWSVDSFWWAPLGLHPPHFSSVDYFPLAPWLGVVLLGMFFGRLWRQHAEKQNWQPSAAPPLAKPLATLGRHSLAIYILHQPILLAGFWLLGFTFW